MLGEFSFRVHLVFRSVSIGLFFGGDLFDGTTASRARCAPRQHDCTVGLPGVGLPGVSMETLLFTGSRRTFSPPQHQLYLFFFKSFRPILLWKFWRFSKRPLFRSHWFSYHLSGRENILSHIEIYKPKCACGLHWWLSMSRCTLCF